MVFDRHEILKRHYAEDLASWNWPGILEDARENAEPEYGEDTLIGRCYLGSVLQLAPSGKFYTFWTTNQTRSDETRDEAFFEALEERANQEGGSIGNGDDPCDLFFEMCVEQPEPEEF